jgi:hypothetical protein
MASVEKRVRNGRVSYRVRYRDPAGRQRSRVFTRKADAQRFLSETENAKLKGTWTDPALGRVRFGEWLAEWWATTTNLRPSTAARDEDYSACTSGRASPVCRWPRLASGTCVPGSQS